MFEGACGRTQEPERRIGFRPPDTGGKTKAGKRGPNNIRGGYACIRVDILLAILCFSPTKICLPP